MLRMPTDDDGAQDYLRVKFGDWATGRIVLPAIHASQTKEPALNPRVKEIEKPAGEWNDLEVVCLGKKVMVTLNGEPMNELDTAPDNEGWLAIAPQGCDVQFRNVRVARRVNSRCAAFPCVSRQNRLETQGTDRVTSGAG